MKVAGWLVLVVAVGGCATAPAPRPSVPPTAPAIVAHIQAIAAQRPAGLAVGELLPEAVCGMPRFAAIAAVIYEERGYRPMLSRAAELTSDAWQAIELLRDVESHGLPAARYPVDRLNDALRRYEVARERYHQVLLPARLAELRTWRSWGPIVRWVEARQRAAAGLASTAALVEVLVIEGALQYALDFRHLTLANPHITHTALEMERGDTIFEGPLIQALRQVASGPRDAMRSWWPTHPYYERTRRALAWYRHVAAGGGGGGWKAERTMREGIGGEDVRRLRARLAAQGFLATDSGSDRFDATLAAALRRFQRHHQVDETATIKRSHGWFVDPTAQALAVSMKQRARQLALSLQRWREHRDEPDELYVRVNIPQFELEVWERGRLHRTHRVAVGKPGDVVDRSTGLNIGANRTPMMRSGIDKIVLNPPWNVPIRIARDELAQRASGRQGWYERNGYRVLNTSSGVRVQQRPGRRNALGRVKFSFPNSQAIFIHDTPSKGWFSHRRRCVSHGCVRLQDPIDLAIWLMERDGSMTEDELRQVLRGWSTRPVTLRRPIPLTLDYNTVTFDEAGGDQPIFLVDWYGYDAAYFRGRLPYYRRGRWAARQREQALREPTEPAMCTALTRAHPTGERD